jgi:6-phosphogluconolactonase
MNPLPVRRFAVRRELDAALAERLGGALAAEAAGAVMLAGGKTPGPAYDLLAARRVRPAPGLNILYSDDRYVPTTSAESNFHLSQPLIRTLGLPESQVLRVPTELPLPDAAQAYAEGLQALLSAKIPVRLGLLGLGADGHTASLFKSADLAAARGRLAIAVQRPDGLTGISVSPDFLAGVEQILFVVAGADKTPALKRLVSRDPALTAWRAVERCPQVEVWTDADAWPA